MRNKGPRLRSSQSRGLEFRVRLEEERRDARPITTWEAREAGRTLKLNRSAAADGVVSEGLIYSLPRISNLASEP